jgi:hypothetical protein
MALTDRQRSRLRGALESVLRAEDIVASVADELAHTGHTEADATLDAASALLKDLIAVLEPLTGGNTRRG